MDPEKIRRNVLGLTTIIRSDKLICLKLNFKKGHGYAKHGTFVAQASKQGKFYSQFRKF